ncbi:hypothetical protein EJ02DRAFT_430387 [Clathrospora elynae]|uniref:Uncharacterized protein n=1 Tax=Clathrospora elynae TaxID=706981 RepID=A0A6A5T3S2_9PLEO|nr:hypothetical protein EJ02DRAFT_430387 [Clathrospora elynae]
MRSSALPLEGASVMMGNCDDEDTILGYDKSRDVLLEAVWALRRLEDEYANGTHGEASPVPLVLKRSNDANGCELIPHKGLSFMEETHIEDDMTSSPISLEREVAQRVPTYPAISLSEFAGSSKTVIQNEIDLCSRPSSPERASTPNIPTYPAIPKLQSSTVATGEVHQAPPLTPPRRRVLPKSSLTKLATVIEHTPPTYQPRKTPPIPSSTVEIVESDKVVEQMATSPASSPQGQDSSSRTISSSASTKSHTGSGVIYIQPSAQLQSMQAISERDLVEMGGDEDSSAPWTSTRVYSMTRQTLPMAYIPTGAPSNNNDVGINKAHARFNNTLVHSSAQKPLASQTKPPTTMVKEHTEWIEDFLARKEETDHFEAEDRIIQERREKRERGLLGRVDSINRFRSKTMISKTAKRGSFEARQERRSKSSELGLDWSRSSHAAREQHDKEDGGGMVFGMPRKSYTTNRRPLLGQGYNRIGDAD